MTVSVSRNVPQSSAKLRWSASLLSWTTAIRRCSDEQRRILRPSYPPAPPSRGTNGLPAGRQKPPCRFAPEVLMNSAGFSDLPNPCTPFQGDKRPSGRSAEASLSLRSGSSDERLCTSLQTRTSCRHIHKSQSLEWRRLPRFRHTIGTAATILCFL